MNTTRTQLLIAVACSLAAACSGDEPAPECELEALRCNGNNLEVCGEAGWAVDRSCGACVTQGTAPNCLHHAGHVSSFAYGVADVRVQDGFQELYSETDLGDSLDWENYPADGGITPGTSATRSIGPRDAVYNTCGTCIIGDIGGRLFMAMSGEVTASVAAAPGEPMQISFTNVLLREVTIAGGNAPQPYRTTDVPNGELWLLDGLTVTAAAERFLCTQLVQGFTHGETRCFGPNIVECIDDNLTDAFPGEQVATTDCSATGDVCAIGPDGAVCTDACSDAQANTTRCNGDRIETCRSRIWVPTTNCDAGEACANVGGALGCHPACSASNTYRCAGGSSQLCNGAVWITDEVCADSGEVCHDADGRCAPDSCSTLNDKRCVQNVLQSCNGTVWQVERDCGVYYTCNQGACGPSACTDSGAGRCAGTTPQVCDGAAWNDAAPCGAGTRCAVTGRDAYCADDCASAGNYRCNDEWRERCDGTSWRRDAHCPSQMPAASCYIDSCRDECYPTEATNRRCGSDGASQVVEQCEPPLWVVAANCTALGRVCEEASATAASCEPVACTTEGATRCVGTARAQTCTGGEWVGDLECTPGSELCALYDGQRYTCADTCTTGERNHTRCSADVLERCNQIWAFVAQCANGCAESAPGTAACN